MTVQLYAVRMQDGSPVEGYEHKVFTSERGAKKSLVSVAMDKMHDMSFDRNNDLPVWDWYIKRSSNKNSAFVGLMPNEEFEDIENMYQDFKNSMKVVPVKIVEVTDDQSG